MLPVFKKLRFKWYLFKKRVRIDYDFATAALKDIGFAFIILGFFIFNYFIKSLVNLFVLILIYIFYRGKEDVHATRQVEPHDDE